MPGKGKGKFYECQCECSNIAVKAATELRSGRSTRCRECGYADLFDPAREIGNKYGTYTIIEFVDMHRRLQRFKIRCDCGHETIQVAAELRRGRTKKCSKCFHKELTIKKTQHGRHKDPIYKVWTSMIARCTNPKTRFYDRYGGRGIKVCGRWLKFANFISDMGERPEGLTIDRINNDGDYEPSNCKWVTHKENCNNRSNKKK